MQEEGASSLAPDLQAQIDETLEEINPRYVLELLALPLSDEYRTKRAEGLQGVRNILWAVGGGGAAAIAGGFTREDFMKEAFLHMTAVEQVSNCIIMSKPMVTILWLPVNNIKLQYSAHAMHVRLTYI